MKLNSLQRRTLQAYVSRQGNAPSISGLLTKDWRRILGITLMCAVAAYWVYQKQMYELVWFASGIWWGFFWTTFSLFRYTKIVWPMIDKIVDWQTARRILADESGT